MSIDTDKLEAIKEEVITRTGDDPLITSTEFAALLGIRPSTFRNYRVRPGHTIPDADIDHEAPPNRRANPMWLRSRALGYVKKRESARANGSRLKAGWAYEGPAHRWECSCGRSGEWVEGGPSGPAAIGAAKHISTTPDEGVHAVKIAMKESEGH